MTTIYGKPWDPKADTGIVFGSSLYSYAQGTQLYNGQKQPVDEAGNVMPLPPVKSIGPVPEPVEMPPVVEDPDEDVPEDEKPIDLVKWANGDEALNALPWFTIRSRAATFLGEHMPVPATKDAVRAAILLRGESTGDAVPMIG